MKIGNSLNLCLKSPSHVVHRNSRTKRFEKCNCVSFEKVWEEIGELSPALAGAIIFVLLMIALLAGMEALEII